MALEHSPERLTRELAEKLATRARHVCLLLGAGASVAAGLPMIRDLEILVRDALPDPYRGWFVDQSSGRNLEQALSRIRRIRNVLTIGESLAGMNADDAADLDRRICEAITKAVDATGKDISAFAKLASWAGRMETHRPIEIFTVNYDLLIEAGLEELGVPYFDGFVGSVKARFLAELIEPRDARADLQVPPGFIRLWKLHGSTNWSATSFGTRQEIVRTSAPAPSSVAIYPSDEKYEESRRVPFVALMDRFRRALLEPETITLVTGYSFGDDHLNELLFDAAQRHPRSEVVALCHDSIPAEVEARASATRNLVALSPGRAIVDGEEAPWADEADIPGVFEDKKFLLGDFDRLSTFLARQVGSGASVT